MPASASTPFDEARPVQLYPTLYGFVHPCGHSDYLKYLRLFLLVGEVVLPTGFEPVTPALFKQCPLKICHHLF